MTGPLQLRIAASLVPLVKLLMIITLPISWPLAKLLDHVLGHHGTMTGFKRSEFKALVRLHEGRRRKARPTDKRRVSRRQSPPITDADAAAAPDAAPGECATLAAPSLRRWDSESLRKCLTEPREFEPAAPMSAFTDDQVGIWARSRRDLGVIAAQYRRDLRR